MLFLRARGREAASLLPIEVALGMRGVAVSEVHQAHAIAPEHAAHLVEHAQEMVKVESEIWFAPQFAAPAAAPFAELPLLGFARRHHLDGVAAGGMLSRL